VFVQRCRQVSSVEHAQGRIVTSELGLLPLKCLDLLLQCLFFVQQDRSIPCAMGEPPCGGAVIASE
jgi:hypothetical protein